MESEEDGDVDERQRGLVHQRADEQPAQAIDVGARLGTRQERRNTELAVETDDGLIVDTLDDTKRGAGGFGSTGLK